MSFSSHTIKLSAALLNIARVGSTKHDSKNVQLDQFKRKNWKVDNVVLLIICAGVV